MENYEVLSFLGEGSFGRVYKAKQIATSQTVALKIISKRGRSSKELKLLRRECEIQQELHHPNIIQMLDSFETDNELVVITEFAHKELNVILGKEGYLPEERVQKIVWDLVSALYYLHSHRVLHRDLKPQNILLDSKDNAKLCDFGFARNMSTGTHVLTSIKGTPLYMAPELIDEHPYDHTADLWSLGCIIYELIMGVPPFCTTSILHLIRKIRHDQIQWPTFISDSGISFLKGLLQKDPSKRLTWPEILKHPFIEGHIFTVGDTGGKPLTRPLSMNTLQLKEQQKKDKLTWKTQTKLPVPLAKPQENLFMDKTLKGFMVPKRSSKDCDCAITDKFSSLSVENDSKKPGEESNQIQTFCFHEDSNPIENEEWLVFLRQTISEVMNGETSLLCQPSFTNIIVSPLQNSNTSSEVLYYVAALVSLPFVVPGALTDKIKEAYIEIKLLPNIIYATKLLMKRKLNVSTESASSLASSNKDCSITDLHAMELKALEHSYLVISYLVHCDQLFLLQLCDSIAVLNMHELLHKMLFLVKKEVRLVIHLLTILTHILRSSPENCEIVEQIILSSSLEDEIGPAHVIAMLRHYNPQLRARLCLFLQFLAKYSQKSLRKLWDLEVKETLEVLVFDSVDTVRNAAELSLHELNLIEPE